MTELIFPLIFKDEKGNEMFRIDNLSQLGKLAEILKND